MKRREKKERHKQGRDQKEHYKEERNENKYYTKERNTKDDEKKKHDERRKQAEVKERVAKLKSRASGAAIPNPHNAGSSTDKPREQHETVAIDESYSYSYEAEAEATPRADSPDEMERSAPPVKIDENVEMAADEAHRASLRTGRAIWRESRRLRGLPRNSRQMWAWAPRWSNSWWQQPWSAGAWQQHDPWQDRRVRWADESGSYPAQRETEPVDAVPAAAVAAEIIAATALAEPPPAA